MYQHDLKQQIEQQWWEECKLEINKVRERRHIIVLERQTNKFIKLLKRERTRERETSGEIQLQWPHKPEQPHKEN